MREKITKLIEQFMGTPDVIIPDSADSDAGLRMSTAIEKLVRDEAEGFAQYYNKKRTLTIREAIRISHAQWAEVLQKPTSYWYDLYKSEQLKTQQHADNV